MKVAFEQPPGELSAEAKRLYRDGPWLRRQFQVWRPYICPHHLLIAEVPPDATVLDVGCGSGLLLGLLATSGRLRSGHGFDASVEAIQLATAMRGRLGEASASLTFEHRNVTDPWPKVDYDSVALIDVMHHVSPEHHQEVSRLACAHVRKGGVLLYKVMVRRPWSQAWGNRLHDLVLSHQWIHYLPIENVRSWISDYGFREERHVRTRQFWYGHELSFFRRL